MSDSKIEATIIIPAWNEEKFIGKCLDGISKQNTGYKFETIVVNNNSTDKTSEVVMSAGFKIINEPRQGVSFARNTGARNAKGEILIFVDSDCIIPTDYVDRVVRYFKNNPGVSVLAGPYIYYDAGPIVRFVTEKLHYYYWYFRTVKYFNGFQGVSGGNMIVRKDAFEKLGGFNEKITDIIEPEDLEFAIRANKARMDVRYEKDFEVLSSFRRTKRSPFKDAYKRAILARSMLEKSLAK